MKRHFFLKFLFIVFSVFFGSQFAAAQTCDQTWRKVDNPRVISGEVTIPAGQTVCVEPGAVVQFTADGAIHLFGRITGAGTSAERITFTGQNVSPNRISVAGTLDLQFADIGIQIAMSQGGSFLSRNCNFGLRGTLTSFSSISSGSGAPFVSIENAVFDSNNSTFQSQNASINGAGWTAILRNVTFRNNAYFNLANSYLFIDNLISQTSAYEGLTFGQDILQPLYLNNLNITNSTRAGLNFLNGNYFIGENVVIQNTEYPVAGAGGLVAGSQVPTSGNRNNWVEVSQACCGQIFAPVGVPYVMQAFNGGVTFLPGVQIKARPNFSFNSEGGTLRVLGLPGAPVTIDPLFPGQKWRGGQFVSSGDRMEYVTLDGSQLGIVDAGFNQATYYIDNSILRNHDTAISAPGFLQGNLFANNGTALDAADGPFEASGRTNPNLFENNTIAVATFASNPDVRYNWWNSPSGPTSPQNPGGTGDVITGNSKFQPFRTARPDLTDHPPVVRMPTVPYPYALGPHQGLLDAGRKVALTWTSSDDRQIVKQKILFSPAGNGKVNFTIIADNLPAAQKSFELLIPSVGFQTSGSPAFVRVVATDDKGQEGWDEWEVLVPSGEVTGDLTITSNVGGQTFRGGEFLAPLTWTTTAPFGTNFQIYLLLDGDRKIIDAGSGNSTGGFSERRMPMVSTDSARFAVVTWISLNRQKWFFTQPFAIRPDPRFVDAAPQISLSSPPAGQQFPDGSQIPIQWTASDDESIRQFNIQASTDGGRTWVQIAENLPPTATNYDWQPNFRGSLNDVRVRVVAVDRRFQNSSDGANRVFSVVAPSNIAPTVQTTFPSDNASFASGKSIFIAANAQDADGAIQRVEFYATSDYLGQGGLPSTTLIGSDATAPFQIAWNYPSAQSYTITAKSIDNRNTATVSAPINITVNPGNPAPLPINPPELDAPNSGQVFRPGSNITLRAVPGTGNRPIVRVDFYNGTQLIGSDASAPYEIVWNRVPQGRYTLFARTIANNGAEATSHATEINLKGKRGQP